MFGASTPYQHGNGRRSSCVRLAFPSRSRAARAAREYGGEPGYCGRCNRYHVYPRGQR
jgi:hypothetical protein